MTPLEILHDVIAIAQMIRRQVILVESNKKRWESVVRVIDQIVASLQGLEELPRQESFIKSLTILQSHLKETEHFLQSVVKMSYLEKFFNAGKIQESIDAHRQAILEQLPLLNLGLMAKQLIDDEQDRQDELKDREAFIVQQEKQLRQRQAEHLKQKQDLESIMRKQMDAFREQLEKNWQAAPIKPSETLLPEQFMVKPYDITFEKKLMSSRTGDIYRGQWKGQAVLVKWIEGVMIEADRQQFIREAQILSQLHNEHFVPFYGACFEARRMCIVTGIVDKPLLEILRNLDEKDRLTMAKDLAEGLLYLHQNKIVHSDIHPKNIGVTQRQEGKWMDLSWVKTNISTIASLGVAHDVTLWQAPETWGHRHTVSSASDIYSFGWLLWTLYTGRLPFPQQHDKHFLGQIQGGLRETIPEACPTVYADLIQRCWSIDPQKRPKISAIVPILACEIAKPRPVSPTGEEYYTEGVRLEQAHDLTAALNCYTLSAAKDYYKSYNRLGLFALPKDPERARHYLQLGAAKGHPLAMYNLARMHEKKQIPSEKGNLHTALFWYKKARDLEPEQKTFQDKVDLISQTLRNDVL